MFTGRFFLNQIYLKCQVPVVIDDRTSTIGGTYTFATGRTTRQDLSATSNRRFEGLNIIINFAATVALVTSDNS